MEDEGGNHNLGGKELISGGLSSESFSSIVLYILYLVFSSFYTFFRYSLNCCQ